MVPAAVEEALRWEPPVCQALRTPTQEVEVGGVAIPANESIVMLLGAANRDPATYDAPDEFRLDRDKLDRKILSFGRGAY